MQSPRSYSPCLFIQGAWAGAAKSDAGAPGVECLVHGFDVLWRKLDLHLVKCEVWKPRQDGSIAALKLCGGVSLQAPEGATSCPHSVTY